MPKAGHEVSEVVALPKVIEAELNQIVRRREAVRLQSDDGRSSGDRPAASNPASSHEDNVSDESAAGDSSQHDRVRHDLVGLALSGGGIRSASFNLGMVQALHRSGVLRHTDYLSTVSGGGYIGAHLASLVLGQRAIYRLFF